MSNVIMLTRLSSVFRRAIGLHGDAVANAAASVRSDDRARGHRERVAADIAAFPDEPPIRTGQPSTQGTAR